MTEVSHIGENQVADVQSFVDQKEISTTSLFSGLLDSLKTGDSQEVKKRCLHLFSDFGNLAYLRDQFESASNLTMLHLDDMDVSQLLEILTRYFETAPAGYASGFPELDDDGGNELRAMNLKRDVLALFAEVTEFIKDPNLKTQYETTFEQLRGQLSLIEKAFENSHKQAGQ